MSENSPAPITLDEQIGYCAEEANRWRHIATTTAGQWGEAQTRYNYYRAIAASLRFLRNHHDLATTQEVEPVAQRGAAPAPPPHHDPLTEVIR